MPRCHFFLLVLIFTTWGPSVFAETTRNNQGGSSGAVNNANCQVGRDMENVGGSCRAVREGTDVLGNDDCKRGRHKGCDFPREDRGSSATVYAMKKGKVVHTGYRSDYGYRVVVQHSDGGFTTYSHIKKGTIAVSVGQSVSVGSKLGTMGNTGDSDGVHLHLEFISASGKFTNDCSAYGAFCR